MTFKGSKLGIADVDIRDRVLTFRVLFADPTTGLVHAHTRHTSVPITEVPGAKDAIASLLESLESWGYDRHFGSQPASPVEQVELPGIQERLETNRFEQG